MQKPKLLVYDHGLFVSFAIKLSKWFDVFYFVPWAEQGFPTANFAFIGDGLEEITRVLDFWKVMPDMDYFFFPDIYSGGLQEHLRSLGKNVFGTGRGDELEIYRWKFKSLMKDVGLPVNDCVRVIGMKALREYLKEHEDVYVKISAYRGTMETFHAVTYKLIEPRLDEIENEIGGLKYVLPFIIESPVKAIIETGYDGYTIDGQYPDSSLYGVEVKDCGYLGAITPFKQLPKEIQFVNSQLSQIFKLVNYRMFFSTEIRIEENTRIPYLVDPTCRAPSPPSELYQELIDNLDEIIIEGSQGVLVQPKHTKKYGALSVIYSGLAEDHWSPIYYPQKQSQWIKLHNCCKIQGTDYIIPSNIRMGEVGAVIGIGDTLLDAIMACKRNAEGVTGYDTLVKVEALVEGLEVIQKGQDNGIKFGNGKIPTVEDIINEHND